MAFPTHLRAHPGQLAGMIWYLPYAPDVRLRARVVAARLDPAEGVQEAVDPLRVRLASAGAWNDVTEEGRQQGDDGRSRATASVWQCGSSLPPVR